MATYLSCTVIRKDEVEENGIDIVDDWRVGHKPFTYAPTSDKAALLCNRFDGINFKECNGRYPGTWKQGSESMAHYEPGFSVNTTQPGERNITWYTVKELHELIQTTPGAEQILGQDFVAGVYNLLNQDPELIIQFSCDQ